MDIVNQRDTHPRLLDTVARAALGRATCGVSVGGGNSRIHLMNDNPPEQRRASDVLNNFGALEAAADLTTVTADSPSPVITCRDAAIAADSEIGYLILRDDEAVLEGRGEVIEGIFALTLNDPLAGEYSVCLFRLRGDYASAIVRIQVDAAQA